MRITQAQTFIGEFLFVVFLFIYLKDLNATTVAYDELKLGLSCFSPLLPTNRLFLYAAYKSGIPVCCLQIGYSSTAVAKLPKLPAAVIKERVE